jgi:hypothetical protein
MPMQMVRGGNGRTVSCKCARLIENMKAQKGSMFVCVFTCC